MSDDPMPLNGITVLDFTANIAGPCTTLVLADMGARVLKVERPRSGDDTRGWPPFFDGTATTFAALNRGKESLVLDLKNERVRESVRRLVRMADVVVQSWRPGKAKALGVGPEDVSRLNSRAIYASISAFGERGPLGGSPGFDAIIQAYSGIMNLTGYPEGNPARVGTGIIDFGTGLWGACAVLGALHARDRTGQGTHVEVPMLGTAMSFTMHHLASVELAATVPTRMGTAQHNAAPYEAIEAADGLVMVGAGNDSLWHRLCVALECEDLESDGRFTTNDRRVANRDELVAALSARTSELSTAAVVDRLREAGVPASAIRSVADMTDDPQANALGLWKSADDGRRYVVSPILSDGTSVVHPRRPPRLGEHTEAVLREFGTPQQEIATLRRSGAIEVESGSSARGPSKGRT